MDIALREYAEAELGTVIEPQEWDEAKENAERKLRGIIEREGDAGGSRRELWYLAQLTVEAVRSIRLTAFTAGLIALDRYASEQMGTKKGQPM